MEGQIAFDVFSKKKEIRWYRLPETRALSKNHIPHEFLKGQLYVSLELTGYLEEWIVETDKNRFGLIPDATSSFNDTLIFWEIDRGTEDYKIIRDKIERYIQMSTANKDIRLHVCFTTITQFDRFGKVKRTAEGRARGILDVINSYERADQFLVTTHDYALKYPTENAFCSFKNPMGISLLELE